MTMRGKLRRPPTVKLRGDSIRSVESTKVLGVVLDTALSFVGHANSIGQRAAVCFGKVSRVSASSWGVRYRALKVLYWGTFVATITYAAACWFERLSQYAVRSAVLRAQRPALILLTKAYRTTSTAALPVLGGVLPADLEVIRAGRVDMLREGAAGPEMRKHKRDILDEVVTLWQKRWQEEQKGRELYRFFPSVSARLKATWVEPDYETSQILGGHGCFRKRLNDLKLCETSVCYCGEEDEDLHHVLWFCPLYEEARKRLLDGITREEPGPVYYCDLVDSEANFGRLRAFAREWHRIRSRLERS